MKSIVFDEDIAIKIGIQEAIMLQHIAEKQKITAIEDIELRLWSVSRTRELIRNLKKQNLCYIKDNIVYFNFEEYCKRFLSVSNNNEDDEFVEVKHKYTDDFEQVWKHYNSNKTNQGSKKNAYTKWKQKNISKLPLPVVFEIINLYRQSVSDISYTKHLSTFLSQEIYEPFSPDLVEIMSDGTIWKGYLFKANYTFYTFNENKLIKKIVLSKNEVDMLQKEGLLKWL